jgi:hypothetical protein
MNMNSFSGSSTKVEGINKLWLNIIQEARRCAPHPLGSKGHIFIKKLWRACSFSKHHVCNRSTLLLGQGDLQLGLIHLLHGGLKRT